MDDRDKNLQRRYGISAEEYDELLEAQGGKCAICEHLPGKKRLAVDHDHYTKEIRGLLCIGCNWLIGRWKDDPVQLKNLSLYFRGYVQSV